MGQPRQALALLEKLAADFPTVARYHRDVAGALHNLALSGKSGKQGSEVLTLFERAIQHEQQALELDPQDATARNYLAKHHNQLGMGLWSLGRRAEAEEHHRQALAILEKLNADCPGVPEYRESLAMCCRWLGFLLEDTSRWAEAEEVHRRALALWEKLVADFPAVPSYRSWLARHYLRLGWLLEKTGRRPEAEALHRQGLAVSEKLVSDVPTVPYYRSELADIHSALGKLLTVLGRGEEAEVHQRRALALREEAKREKAVPEAGRAVSGPAR